MMIQKDSLIKSSHIKKIESEHFQSDMIVVRGLRTGYVKAHISLNEKGYEHVSDVVSLIIIESFKNEFLLNIAIPPNYRMIESSIYLLLLIWNPSSEVEASA